MAGKKERSDTRLNVARYQVDKLAPGTEADAAAAREDWTPPELDDEENSAGQFTPEQHAQYVEIVIEQAMRRGEFDNLPGAGKPLAGLNQTYDPDWWIRKKIEREQLTGLGPPALTLRTEDASLDERLDEAPSEFAVREILEDFNKRIISARRQLQGGPPVVTQTRDVDAEVARWAERRSARYRARALEQERRSAELASMTWRERRRALRQGF
ncbi:DUF1992 domain-containing protein [Glaciihabitans sp. dw_435]|uniref:DnaJ family domain-containing protein n=1 Tax=Glaciihabitans sp. dw_435 TaxID=2720081 RepID=UPI0027DE0EDB|nr:DUF1992 domain-containing protein [Glaciihabitans sp. dw_435]